MNFLLHRHLAATQLGSPLAGVGATLPDLWRMADRRVHAKTDVPADDDVTRGVAHHLAADVWFHESEVFSEGERATLASLRAAPFRAERMGLFAHVAWELCLDSALVARVGADAMVEGLRAPLDEARALATMAAERHHFSRVTRSYEERRRFEARMERIFTELARGPWIARYATPEGVALVVSSLRERVGMVPLDEEDLAHAAGALRSIEPLAFQMLDALLANAPAFLSAK